MLQRMRRNERWELQGCDVSADQLELTEATHVNNAARACVLQPHKSAVSWLNVVRLLCKAMLLLTQSHYHSLMLKPLMTRKANKIDPAKKTKRCSSHFKT